MAPFSSLAQYFSVIGCRPTRIYTSISVSSFLQLLQCLQCSEMGLSMFSAFISYRVEKPRLSLRACQGTPAYNNILVQNRISGMTQCEAINLSNAAKIICTNQRRGKNSMLFFHWAQVSINFSRYLSSLIQNHNHHNLQSHSAELIATIIIVLTLLIPPIPLCRPYSNHHWCSHIAYTFQTPLFILSPSCLLSARAISHLLTVGGGETRRQWRFRPCIVGGSGESQGGSER